MKTIAQLVAVVSLWAVASDACDMKLTSASGTIKSPNYPNNYSNNLKCKYKFSTGTPVVITCSDFDLESVVRNGRCRGDTFTVNDGGTKKVFCADDGPDSYVTSSSKVTVLFKTNARKNKKGFQCDYESATTTTGTTTTPVPQGTTSAFVTKAIDSYEAGICYTGRRSTCGCSVTQDDSQYYTSIMNNDERLVVANGIPKHVYEVGQTRPNPNTACPHEVYMAVPRNPVKSNTYTGYGMGPVGIAVSGGFFYNHLSNPDGTVAAANEAISFDTCHGHSDGVCRYHYHLSPICINGHDSCGLLGYMRDGFPVYANCTSAATGRVLNSCYRLNAGEDGSLSQHYTYSETAYSSGECELDRANGYTFRDGSYGYVFTDDYPFIMTGYYGTRLGNICYLEDN